MKPLIYIAGPYTKPDPVMNTRDAIIAGLAIADSGLAAVEIPHLTLLANIVEPREIDYWYDFDLDKLEHCNALLRLPGQSDGADKEVAHARALHIPVFHESQQLITWLISTNPTQNEEHFHDTNNNHDR